MRWSPMPILIIAILGVVGCGGSDDSSSSPPDEAGDEVPLADFVSHAEDVCSSQGKLDFDRGADLGEIEAARRELTDEVIRRLRNPQHLPTEPAERDAAERFVRAFADDADARADLLQPFRGATVYARLAESRQRLRDAKAASRALVRAGEAIGAERCISAAERDAAQPVP